MAETKLIRYSQNKFIAGETGERISALRQDDLYKVSASNIEDFLITDLGNLKIAKQYTKELRSEITGSIIKVINSKYNYNIIITTTGIKLYEKDTFTFISKHDVTLEEDSSVEFIENTLFTTNGIFDIDPVNHTIIANTKYAEDFSYPYQNRSKITVDIYQTRTLERTVVDPANSNHTIVEQYVLPILLGTVSEQDLTITTGNVYLKGTDHQITRFYKNYVANFTEPHTSKFTSDEYFLVTHPFLEDDNGNFYVGKNIATYDVANKLADENGTYYTALTTIDGEGTLEYGELVDILTDYEQLTEFQNRIVIVKDSVLYFSKSSDYNNFTNDTSSSDPFFIKLSPINGEQGQILKLIAGKGLYVITDKGIYIIGYNSIISPSSVSAILATDESASANATLIDKNLYFMQTGKFKNKLYCLQDITSKELQTDFKAFPVDKFSYREDYGKLSSCEVGGTKYLIANSLANAETNTDKCKVYLYTNFDIGNFVRTTLFLDEDAPVEGISGDVTGFLSGFIGSGFSYVLTDNNKKNGFLGINPPPLITQSGGLYMNDVPSRLKRFIVKVLEEVSEDTRAIEDVYIKIGETEERLNQLGADTASFHNIYKVELGSRIDGGLGVRIKTKENSNILELQAFELFLDVRGD